MEGGWRSQRMVPSKVQDSFTDPKQYILTFVVIFFRIRTSICRLLLKQGSPNLQTTHLSFFNNDLHFNVFTATLYI